MDEMIRRTLAKTDFQTRSEENGDLYIEGYFVVFDSRYQITKKDYETIARGAFAHTLDGDIKALINHNTEKVLGRTKAKTLELREDDYGLWGSILINPKDQDAMNCHARVERGDVDQCSFGFIIKAEETELLDDGGVHFTIKEVELHEVSVVTFPAYGDTSVSARSAEADKIRDMQAWRLRMANMLKGEK